MSDLFSPSGGWRVRILDLSGGADEGVVEEVGGFPTLMQANEFARRYVRDSLERCRAPGMTGDDVLAAWSAFGEDAEVLTGADTDQNTGWRSAPELARFAAAPADRHDRDWRSLDPRRVGGADDDDGPDDPEGDGA